MAASTAVFIPDPDAPSVPSGLPLVVLLTGFTDAGGAVAGTIEHLAELNRSVIGTFDTDVLLDYRARRPVIVFDTDHLSEYHQPRLELVLVDDALGQQFLLLEGFEPDFLWEEFIRTVLDLAEAMDVAGLTWVHSIPMPVPHTRPLGTTVSGNRAELTAELSIWQPRTQVPSTAGHVLEYRAAEAGLPVVGFVILVPHYLAETEYPTAVLTALDRIARATGRVFPVDEVRAAEEVYLQRVDEQIRGNDEVSQMVTGIEERHDAYLAARAAGGENAEDHLLQEGDLPSADELAAELERYLASRPSDEDKPGR